MKFLILFCLFLLSADSLLAQSEMGPCDCRILERERMEYMSEMKANQLLQSYISQLAPLSKIKKTNDRFYIRVAFCPGPVSQICEMRLPDGTKESARLILYNNAFLERLNAQKKETTLVDKHVLLHELGHHVLGHHKNAKTIEILRIPYENDKADPKRWKSYGSSNPMAQELEADIYAVWALSKLEKGFSVDALINGFNQQMLTNLDKEAIAKRKAGKKPTAEDGTAEKYLDHPLFRQRMQTMKRYAAELNKPTGAVPKRYFSDLASTAYLALWPESYVYDISLTAGVSLAGKTDFKAGDEKTDAFLYPLEKFENYHFGLSIDRFRWDKPWQTGADLQWSRHQYGTTVATNDGSRLTETLKVSYLTFTPKILWNSIGASKQQSLHALRVGFIAGLGINARLPVGKLSYVNYVSNAAAPELLFSVGPKVIVGASIMRKSFMARGFKVLFSYDPQWIRMKAGSDAHALSHNLECTLQYSVKRW
jgi:hypothetical protein